MAAPIQINLQGIQCSFDIGASPHAEKAKAKYQNYLNHHRFEDLSACLSQLLFCTRENDGPQNQRLKLNVCMACNAIAISTINQNFNNYQRIFISSSLINLIATSGQMRLLERICLLWVNTQSDWVSKVMAEGLDEKLAREAGVTLIRSDDSDSFDIFTIHK